MVAFQDDGDALSWVYDSSTVLGGRILFATKFSPERPRLSSNVLWPIETVSNMCDSVLHTILNGNHNQIRPDVTMER